MNCGEGMQMKRNVGTIDRLVRLVLAIVFIIVNAWTG